MDSSRISVDLPAPGTAVSIVTESFTKPRPIVLSNSDIPDKYLSFPSIFISFNFLISLLDFPLSDLEKFFYSHLIGFSLQ